MSAVTTCVGFLFFFQCEAPATPPPIDTYCQNTRYIRWDTSDTRQTKEQVDTHNRVRKALCRDVQGSQRR